LANLSTMIQVMTSEMPPHQAQGTKRPPENDLENEQRLAKRFNRMNLRKSLPSFTRLRMQEANRRIENHIARPQYIPVTNHSSVPVSAQSSNHNALSSAPPQLRRKASDSSLMQVEDTPTRIFIHDLDSELADEVESDSERPIFVPDIEKHLMKLPRAVLIGDSERKAMENMQMVLYKIPKSISVPEEEDSVRRAIREARQRARDQQPLRIPDAPRPVKVSTVTAPIEQDDYDPDAMDIG
jgi:hypothetical protein